MTSTTRSRTSTVAHRATALLGLLAGLALALALSRLEAALPITPTWIWAEVVLGVLTVGSIVTGVRRAYAITLARTYEQLVMIAFCATGVPIIVWQLLLAAAR
jgi:hypothetical protein